MTMVEAVVNDVAKVIDTKVTDDMMNGNDKTVRTTLSPGSPASSLGLSATTVGSPSPPPPSSYIDRANVISYLLSPRSVAVVGATERPNTVGRTTFENLESHYGPIDSKMYKLYPVNPGRTHVLGHQCYKSVSAIEDSVDMVVVIVPAKSVPEIIEDCGKKGTVKIIEVFSAGFKEVGEEGLKLELQCLDLCRNYNMRLVGPNCLGVMNPVYGLNASFAATAAPKGSISFLSQSGAMCTAMLDWASTSGVGFSSFVSIGSMSDVNWADLIEYIGSDAETRAIMIYMESIGDAGAFLRAAKKVTEKKPIFVIKGGRTASAAEAAVSHTGSLVGSHEVFVAAMKRVGVVLIDSIHELEECALLFDKQPRPAKCGVTIITNAGGPGVLTTDAAELAGIPVNELPKSLCDELSTFLPAAWSHHNPVDILGDASPEAYAKALQACLENSEYTGAIVVVLTPQSVTEPTGTARRIVEVYHKWRKYNPDRILPLVCSWMGGDAVKEGFKHLNSNSIPCFANPDSAVHALGCMFKQVKAIEHIAGTPLVPSMSSVKESSAMDQEKVRTTLSKVRADKRVILSETESKDVLKAYGIKVAESIICQTAEEAAEKAEDFPCVLKLNSETITHKSDVGGVKLHLMSKQEVKVAFDEIKDSVTRLKGAEHFGGVSLQPMLDLSKGIELLVGSCSDVQLGPVCVFGAGGCMVEIMKDTTLSLPPLTLEEASLMIDRTKISKALKGCGNERFPGCAIEPIKSVLQKFSYLMFDFWNEIGECEINPLLALKDKVIALDARVVLRTEEEQNKCASPCLKDQL